jgi:hypothetical protein
MAHLIRDSFSLMREFQALAKSAQISERWHECQGFHMTLIPSRASGQALEAFAKSLVY